MIKKIVAGVVVFIGLILVGSSFETVNEGTRGLVFNMGRADRVVEPGFYWLNPFTESVKTFDVKTQKVDAPASAATRDMQTINTTVTIAYEVDSSKIKEIYQKFGLDYESVVITPAIQEEVKAATAKYTAEESITRRSEVKGEIYDKIKERAAQSNLIIRDVYITDFAFSPSFNEAVEAKVKAEQDALASKNKLEQTKYEAEQKVVSATAEAEAIRIQAQAVTSQGGADYVKLKMIEKWSGVGCTSYCGDNFTSGLLMTK